MSKYTTEVRFICEAFAGLEESKGFDDVEQIITQAAPEIFNFSFPVFDENYRLPLEKTILRHFYTREIGEETVGLWRLRLWDRLNIIMPFYNKLYLTETLSFNPLYDVDYTRTTKTESEGENASSGTESTTGSRTGSTTDGKETTRTGSDSEAEDISRTTGETTDNSGTVSRDQDTTETRSDQDTKNLTETRNLSDGHTGQASGTSSNTQWNLYQDTPQGGLSGVEDQDYLTDARKITDNGSTSGSDSYTDTHTGTVTQTGTDTHAISGSGTLDYTDTTDMTTEKSGEETVDRDVTRETSESITEQAEGSSSESTTGSRTTSETGTVSNTTDFIEKVSGKMGGQSYAAMIREYREALINIDQMILNELEDLFMQLW